MVHGSPTNAMKIYIHQNIDTWSIKSCENCELFAPILSLIKTKNINKTKNHFPARQSAMIVSQRTALFFGHVGCQCCFCRAQIN